MADNKSKKGPAHAVIVKKLMTTVDEFVKNYSEIGVMEREKSKGKIEAHMDTLVDIGIPPSCCELILKDLEETSNKLKELDPSTAILIFSDKIKEKIEENVPAPTQK